jgi:hypothetical protein
MKEVDRLTKEMKEEELGLGGDVAGEDEPERTTELVTEDHADEPSRSPTPTDVPVCTNPPSPPDISVEITDFEGPMNISDPREEDAATNIDKSGPPRRKTKKSKRKDKSIPAEPQTKTETRSKYRMPDIASAMSEDSPDIGAIHDTAPDGSQTEPSKREKRRLREAKAREGQLTSSQVGLHSKLGMVSNHIFLR